MFGVLSVLHTSIYLRRKGGLVADLTVIILTKNEELNIPQCIESVKSIAKRVVVVDSFSTDNTVDIAKRMEADVYQHEFINHSKQFKWALENTNIRTKWVLRIDADERLTPETAIEIEEKTKAHENDNVNGFLIKRRNYFLGRFIRHGGMYPLKFLRPFKHGKADVEDRNMDEHIVLLEGRYLELENDLLHFDFKDLHSRIAKHNEYARKEVQDYFEKREERIGYLDTKRE
ncbi:glycosyltransferase family 2 protein [Fervidobacterium ngatamarikiense]|uniref:glycosyltransferase family 2 protein n=1 Tax=Fervidobacterium ngatamarikiense TaxID=3389972 RepID=UPI000AA752A1|nr:glycosyltransferase family 2 protein [Fervidobacterium pennivorans]